MSQPVAENSRIFLTGFMGAGKSTIGRLLANRLGYKFYDTDKMMVKGFHKSVSRIFRENGEDTFRAAELQVLHALAKRNNLVISTGGGTLARQEAMDVALAAGTVIYLKAPAEDLYERVIFSPKDRPILDVPDTEVTFHELYAHREQFYQQAHHTVETHGNRPDHVVDVILQRLGMQADPT